MKDKDFKAKQLALLRKSRDYESCLKQAAVWNGSAQTIAKIESSFDQSTAEKDYIYEFYCFVSVLSDLNNRYRLDLEYGSQYKRKHSSNKINFPKKAGKKANWPYFILSDDKGAIAQICCGTMVETQYSTKQAKQTCAPDISFQKPDAAENPTYSDVSFIHDAKYMKDKEGKPALNSVSYSDFARTVRKLRLNSNKSLPAIKVEFSDTNMKANCILTNATEIPTSVVCAAEMKADNIKIITNFNA